jgi:hypothetical protein
MAEVIYRVRDRAAGSGVQFVFDTVDRELTRVDVVTTARPLTITAVGQGGRTRTVSQEPNLTRSYDVSIDRVRVTRETFQRPDGSTKERFSFPFRVAF